MDAEDAEIVPSEDEIGGYTPLERPAPCVDVQTELNMNTVVYSDQEEGQLSSSDSDSDDLRKTKVLKRKLKTDAVEPPINLPKKKKFSIWSDVLQEDAIENQFLDSNFFGRSRGNETYNYRMKYFTEDRNDGNRDTNMEIAKQNSEDSKPRKKLKSRSKRSGKKLNETKTVVLSKLDVTIDDSEIKVATDIAEKLNESNYDLIHRIVDTLGKQKAIDIFYKTRKIELEGGFLTLDKSRRRTSGGVYIKLIKHKLSKKDFDAIFKTD